MALCSFCSTKVGIEESTKDGLDVLAVLCAVWSVKALLVVVREGVSPILEMVSLLIEGRLVLVSHLVHRPVVVGAEMVVEAGSVPTAVEVTTTKRAKKDWDEREVD